jgi:cytochrome P450
MALNSMRFRYRTLPFLDSYKNNTGGILDLRSRSPRRLLVWHPDGIDWIFRSDRGMQHVPSRTLSPLLGRTSLLWAEGPRHSAYRRVLGPALQGASLQAYHSIISHTVQSALDVLVPGTVVSLVEWSRQVTLRIISQLLLGRADTLLLELFSSHITRVLGSRARALSYRCPPASTSSWLPFLTSRHELDSRLLKSAKATAESPSPPLVALLLSGKEPLGALGDRELADQIVSLLFAGHETTASATSWTLYWLSREDNVRRDIIAELDATSNDGSDPEQVPLLHAASQETLRLCPPAFIAGKRKLTTDGELLDTPVTAGTVITPCMYLAHHQPTLFPHPHRFDPSRFLGTRVPHRYYFPFGGGTRHCLGSKLAMVEIRMITAAVLRRYELRCVNPEAGIPILRGPAMTLPQNVRMLITTHHRTPGKRLD